MSYTSRYLLGISIAALMLLSGAPGPVAAQELVFTTPDGRSVTASSLSGRVVVLVFSSINDPQCRDEFGALSSLTQHYAGKNVSIFWVSVDPPGEVSNDRLKSPCGSTEGVSVLRDPNQAAFKRFSAKRPQVPTLVVLDQQGQVHGQPRGGFNPSSDFTSDMSRTIDGLLRK